ncbi:MAG: ATP-dependent zinc metalloprotease FtsH [Chlamydiales bacterium]|nr:ATP-dependent zinc metalloprotease FtsH [Chlamydiales bacterium]
MANDNNLKQDPTKKNFPASFFFFLLMAVLVVVIVQNYMGTKMAKVSFSYQLEHLVNLDLIQPEDSRKIALNDNLVTFSGKFRTNETEEGKKRFKFLELLNQNHGLNALKDQELDDLNALQTTVKEAADWYLHLSGIPLPQDGYKIVEDSFDTPERENHIIITSLSKKPIESVPALQEKLTSLEKSETLSAVDTLGTEVVGVIQSFRSPLLGIGNDTMKQNLKTLFQDVSAINNNKDITAQEKLAVYQKALTSLQSIITELSQVSSGMRLNQLRSVRSYRDEIEQYTETQENLEQNNAQLDKARQSVTNVIWFFNNQQFSTRALEKQDGEAFGRWFADAKEEWDNFAINKGELFRAPDQPLNLVLEKTFKSEEPAPNYLSYILTILPVILVVFLLYFVFSRQMKGMGGGAMNFGKSPAKLLNKSNTKVTFKDVAGIDEAKEELQEIVDFLKNPTKFTALGAKIPKGVLCVGAPGTGKTLLAKAVAGEADRPFFSISGSDFVEMFVGVGASRIRDMFDQAKKNAPCLIFMDEIDAVGRHRGAGIGGGHDEREQTLNQLLVEMDGFDTNEGVILMAATNRPDVLDKALLRPGRFDRRVIIDLPDIKGRYEILKVHARKIKIDPTVDLMLLARATPGSSGADLANVLNEAALLAARKGKSAVGAQDVNEASDKVRYGKQRRSLELDENEKKTTAYHESGHAIVGLVVKHADPVEKVTIIPRGLSLGATHFLPRKNRVSYWKQELLDQLAVIMGGRCAEEIFIKDVSSGAQQDITQATYIARSMVCEWGMSEVLGLVAYEKKGESGQYLGMSTSEKNYSDETAKAIDEQVRIITDAAHKRAIDIINEHTAQVDLMAKMLIEFETLDSDDVKKILDGTWDIEEKRGKLKAELDLQKKQGPTTPPPPPPLPVESV